MNRIVAFLTMALIPCIFACSSAQPKKLDMAQLADKKFYLTEVSVVRTCLKEFPSDIGADTP